MANHIIDVMAREAIEHRNLTEVPVQEKGAVLGSS